MIDDRGEVIGEKGIFPETYVQLDPEPVKAKPKPPAPAQQAAPAQEAAAPSTKKKQTVKKEKKGQWIPIGKKGTVKFKFVANGKFQLCKSI